MLYASSPAGCLVIMVIWFFLSGHACIDDDQGTAAEVGKLKALTQRNLY